LHDEKFRKEYNAKLYTLVNSTKMYKFTGSKIYRDITRYLLAPSVARIDKPAPLL